MSYEKLIKSEKLCASLMRVNTQWQMGYAWRMVCLVNIHELTCTSIFYFFHILANELILCLFLLVSNMVSTFKHTTLHALLSFLTKKTFWNNIFALYFHLLHFSRLFLVSNVQSHNGHCTYLKRKILNRNWFWFLQWRICKIPQHIVQSKIYWYLLPK